MTRLRYITGKHVVMSVSATRRQTFSSHQSHWLVHQNVSLYVLLQECTSVRQWVDYVSVGFLGGGGGEKNLSKLVSALHKHKDRQTTTRDRLGTL